jgi:hypothetical protein
MHFQKNEHNEPGVMVHACNASTQGAEAELPASGLHYSSLPVAFPFSLINPTSYTGKKKKEKRG